MDRNRRSILRGAALLGAVGAPGCLGVLDRNPNVTLPEPERRFDSSDVVYPAWGERIPDTTVHAPLDGTRVSTSSVGEPSLITFFYSYCQTVCPVLISTMRNVQTHSLNNGYGDGVRFLAVTFDPERDTRGRLEEYAEKMNISTEDGNWSFLRPESKERAEDVVNGEFGVGFQRTHPEDMDRYMFTHTSLTLLVNADGYVERAYTTQSPEAERIVDDMERIRKA